MMQRFDFKETKIPGLLLVDPFVVWDERGYFIKDYSKEVFEQQGISHDLKEVFYTNSFRGVMRAMHFQRERQQAKLVRCVYGKVYDVVCDLRKDSLAFGQWVGYELSEENKKELLIPEGCGHGYLVLEDSIVSYKCAEKFYGEYDDGIIWNDSELAIDWPVDKISKIILSEKDMNLQSFEEFKTKYGGF